MFFLLQFGPFSGAMLVFGGVVVAVNQKCGFLFSSFGSCLSSWPMGLLIINLWTFRSNRFWNLSGRPQDSKTNRRIGMIGCQRRHENVGSIEEFHSVLMFFVGSVLMDSNLDSWIQTWIHGFKPGFMDSNLDSIFLDR